MYSKCGFIKEVQLLFELTLGKDAICWNSMISTYAQHRHAEEALRVLGMMRGNGVEPNYVTLVGVLCLLEFWPLSQYSSLGKFGKKGMLGSSVTSPSPSLCL
jgi:pentatricopeptide repeat protein